MKSFDTNVAVRLVVEDDPAQCDRAAGAFRQAIATEGVFFSATVLVEVAWVLRVACKQDRASIAAALCRLVSTSGSKQCVGTPGRASSQPIPCGSQGSLDQRALRAQ
ncbi:MAG: hypothetical protein WCI05_14495 [Myxococcales bacterium]